MKGINPYRFTNISLAGLVLWRIVLALSNVLTDGIEITGTKLLVFMIGAGMFYMSMLPIAEYFTGQKLSHVRVSTVLFKSIGIIPL